MYIKTHTYSTILLVILPHRIWIAFATGTRMLQIWVRTDVGFGIPHRRECAVNRPKGTDELVIRASRSEHHTVQVISILRNQLSNFDFEVGDVRTYEMFESEVVKKVITVVLATIRRTLRIVQACVHTTE